MKVRSTSALLAWSDSIATYGMLAAGIIHTGFTPVFKPACDEEALWFAGTGLGLCFLAGMNIMQRTTAHPATSWLTRAANVAGTGYMVLVAQSLRAPHAYTVLAFTSVTALDSFLRPTQTQPSQQI